MCGFAGFLDPETSRTLEQMRQTAGEMASRIQHRGPDDSGEWADAAAGIAMGFRRLSIVDLSPSGHQPMMSACARYVIVFNGEIYNHETVRQEINSIHAHSWRGKSDTEVMLAAISLWGLSGALNRFTGMFAFALWDRSDRKLHLCRDRMGEKPLYYGWASGVFLFGSELKAFKAIPGWRGEIDRGSVALYLRYCYVPAPYSIFKGIRKLPPGTCLAVPATIQDGELPQPTSYWSLREVIGQAAGSRYVSEDDAVADLEGILGQTVREQMVADVPLGAFLSGGVDSSLIVSLMQAHSRYPVNTYTIGFNEPEYNEAGFAKDVARHLGTAHTELYVTAAQAMEVIPKLPSIYDEPFSDSSQIPTYLVSQLARQHVTVALSGDGGDESFGGYRRYILGNEFWNVLRRIPLSGRRRMVAVLKSSVFGLLASLTLKPRLRDYLEKIAEKGDPVDADELYYWLVSNTKWPAEAVIDGSEPESLLLRELRRPITQDFAERMMYLDSISYLPDDIMAKVDRASMSVSLETRAPFLDRRVVEFAWHLPRSMKIRNGISKWLLRKVLDKHVPRHLIERPKMGFGVPIGEWLRGPLRAWAEDLLDENLMRRDGIIKVEPVRLKWHEHITGRRNWEHYLWNVITFQAWMRTERNASGV